jgi:hypothetical protein
MQLGNRSVSEVDSETADWSGQYTFDTPEGQITGTVYAENGVPLPRVTVRLLRDTAAPTEYAVMVDDPGFWGVRIAPYPPDTPPLVQDFEMGLVLRARLKVNGVWANGEGIALKLLGQLVDADGQEQGWEMLWPGAEHAGLLWNGSKQAYIPNGREFAVETRAVTGQGDGWACERLPVPRDYITAPKGHGALCQRPGDFRDDSTETAQADLQWSLTEVRACYKGMEVTVPLDGSVAVIDYRQASLRIHGDAGARICYYHKSRPYPASPTAWTESSWVIPVDPGYVDVLVDAGEYSFAGYVYNGTLLRYTDVTAGLVKIDLDWGDGEEITLKPLTTSWAPGNVTVLAVRGGDPAVGVETWWYEQWEGEWTWFYKDTADDEGLVAWEECFWDEDNGCGCWARFVGSPIFPIIAVSQRVAITHPSAEPNAVCAVFCGHPEDSGYWNLPAPEAAAYVRPKPGQSLASVYDHVKLVTEYGSGKAVSEIPLPRWEMNQRWPWWEYADHVITWQLMADDDTVLAEFEVETTQHFVVAGQVLEDLVGARIKGGVLASSHEETTWQSVFEPKRLGAEFGEPPPLGTRAIGVPKGGSEENDVPAYPGPVGLACAYCGAPAFRDPADAAYRWCCPNCLQYEILSRAVGYFETSALAATTEAQAGEVGSFELHLQHFPSDRLRARYCKRRAHYRPECYLEDNGHAETRSEIQQSTEHWWAHHVQLGRWDWLAGFTDLQSMSGQAASEGPTGREIGPVQPKMEVLEEFSATQEIRVTGRRTDGSEMYFYGTVLPFPENVEGDIVRFSDVLPDATLSESARRPLASIHNGDGEPWPHTSGDVIDDITAADALGEDGEWHETAAWLIAGRVGIVNDNPSYRWHEVHTRAGAWTLFLTHALFGQFGRPHIFHDQFMRKFLFYVDSGDVCFRYGWTWEDLQSDETSAAYGQVTADGQNDWPWADKSEDGQVVLVREVGGDTICVRASTDNCQSWSDDVSIATGEKPRGCLFGGRLYLTRITSGIGQVARSPVGDYAELDTWPDGTVWKDIGPATDPVPVDKDVGNRAVVFALSDGDAIDIYVSVVDGEDAQAVS